MGIVVPAVLPASRQDLIDKLTLFADLPSVRRIQIDVVDGRFAKPASWPYTAPAQFSTLVARSVMLPHLDRIEYEIDLMCADAETAAASWLQLGASRLTFHAESTTNLAHLIGFARQQFGDDGIVSLGLALNVASSLALVEQCMDKIQYVQFMGITRIGKQGQPFDPAVFEKVRVFRERHPAFPIQVDGGISLPQAEKLVSLKVSNLVVGSGLLKNSDPAAALMAFESLATPYGV